MTEDPVTSDLLTPILSRKRRENERRHAHLGLYDPRGSARTPAVSPEVLRRGGASLPRVIAEIKFRSPSAGSIRERHAGDVVRIARSYRDAGASAISVLCDRVGFGGSVLDLRRAASAVETPLLFKDFVLDELQLDFARAVGASFVLLLVRALDDSELLALRRACVERGLLAIVEAANAAEVERAAAAGAAIIGVNARDLCTFRVDPDAAARAIEKVPVDRVAVYMSGVSDAADLRRIAETRTDAVLIGTGLMQTPDPQATLRAMLAGAG